MSNHTPLLQGIYTNDDLDDDILKLYLTRGMWRMGDMFDYAVNTLGYDLKVFFEYFIDTGISNNIEILNPVYVMGMSGRELAHQVLFEKFGHHVDLIRVKGTFDKSPEFWLGWILFQYQHTSRRSYGEIASKVPVEQIRDMYWPYHEMSVEQFFEAMDSLCDTQNNKHVLR